MNDWSRRAVLGTGAAGLAAAAGCASLPGADGGDGGDGDTRHFDWFGPDVVGARWMTQNQAPDEIPDDAGIGMYGATHPGRLDVDRLGTYGDGFDGDGNGELGVLLNWTEYSIPWSAVDTRVLHRALGGYDLYSGSFDAAAIRDALEPEAVRTESLDDGAVHVFEEDSQDSISHSGVAATGDHIALVSAPGADSAARLARAFVETRLGDRPRFHEESELLRRVIDHLAPGFEYGGNWRPLWHRERFGETTVSGPWVWSRRVVDGTVRQTTVEWQDESERAERTDASVLAAEFEESEHSEDVSVTYDDALRIVDARQPTWPPS